MPRKFFNAMMGEISGDGLGGCGDGGMIPETPFILVLSVPLRIELRTVCPCAAKRYGYEGRPYWGCGVIFA